MLWTVLLPLLMCSIANPQHLRNLTIDYLRSTFLLNGKPMQYIAGEMHYFRVPSSYWRDRLTKMRYAGVNVVSTPIEWSFHEPSSGQFIFAGEADVEYFIQLAWQVEMFVIIRAGPYIDADRDLGGLPAWLLFEESLSQYWLRSTDPTYIHYSERWLRELLPRLRPYLYENGGPILMIQMENYFGHSSRACHKSYLQSLHALFVEILGNNTILFTADESKIQALTCSKLDGVLLASNYDFDKIDVSFKSFLKRLTDIQPFGPVVTSELITGHICSWDDCKEVPKHKEINVFFNKTLAVGGSVNFYMFVAGTNFGFTAGSSGELTLGYTTSYDNNAPINTAGDPTEQFYNIKAIINNYHPLPRAPPLAIEDKSVYPELSLEPFGSPLDSYIKQKLALAPMRHTYPQTFRKLKQGSGFVLYETRISFNCSFLAILESRGVADRGYVFFRHIFVGYLTRYVHNKIKLVHPEPGDLLQIFVENTGRLSKGFLLTADIKGIHRPVMLAGVILKGWTMYRFPLSNIEELQHVSQMSPRCQARERGPMFYRGTFQTTKVSASSMPHDTYLDMQMWSKGVVFVNSYNLGRYWPMAGPQVTLYLPGCWLKPYPQENFVVLLELERPPLDSRFKIGFLKSAIYTDKRKNIQHMNSNGGTDSTTGKIITVHILICYLQIQLADYYLSYTCVT